MSTATNRWKLGLFVVLGHFLGLGALIWLGAQNFERESYEIVTYVDEAVQGLDIGSAVKIRGVPVGGVTTIRLADQDHRHVEITCEIFSDLLDRDLYAGENGSFFSENIRAKITAAGITGAKYVLLDFFDEERDAVAELPFDPPTNYVPSVPSTLKSLEEGIREILDTLPTILTDAVETMDRLKEILVRLDVESMAAEAERIMKTFSDKLEQLDLEQLNEQSKSLMAGANRTMKNADELVKKLQDLNVESPLARMDELIVTLKREVEGAKVAETTEALRQTASEFSKAANLSAGRWAVVSDELQLDLIALRQALESVRALAALLERDPGSLLRGKQDRDGDER